MFFVLCLSAYEVKAQFFCSTGANIQTTDGEGEVLCAGRSGTYRHSFSDINCEGYGTYFIWKVRGANSILASDGTSKTGINGGYIEFGVSGAEQNIYVQWGTSTSYSIQASSEYMCGWAGLCGRGGANLSFQAAGTLPTAISASSQVFCGTPSFVTFTANNTNYNGITYNWPGSLGANFTFSSQDGRQATYYYNGGTGTSSSGGVCSVSNTCNSSGNTLNMPIINIGTPNPSISGSSVTCRNSSVSESYTANPSNGTATWVLTGAGWSGSEDENGGYTITQTGANAATLTATIQSACYSSPRGISKQINVSTNMACYQRVAPPEKPIFTEAEFTVYPNPTNQILNISLPIGTEVSEIKILDTMGNLVKTFNKEEKQDLRTSVANFKEGLYTVMITTTETVIAKKLQISK